MLMMVLVLMLQLIHYVVILHHMVQRLLTLLVRYKFLHVTTYLNILQFQVLVLVKAIHVILQ